MSTGANSRGRGRGSRGGLRGEPGIGRGRGSRYRGRGRGRGVSDFVDEWVQVRTRSEANRGTASPRSRGRGNGGHASYPNSGSNTPIRGRESPGGRGWGRGDFGHQSPRGRGRGRGGSKLRPNAPLSALLYQERPFLKPVVFVRSVFTKTLFQEEEEILQPIVEEVGEGEQSHVPTAERVSRVFSGRDIPKIYSSASEDDQGEKLEEIDFNDTARLLAVPVPIPSPMDVAVADVEKKFTGFCIDAGPSPIKSSSHEMSIEDTTTPTTAEPTGFHIGQDPMTINVTSTQDDFTSQGSDHIPTLADDTPTPVATHSDRPLTAETSPMPPIAREEFTGFYIDTEPSTTILPHQKPDNLADAVGELQDDEEIIVYVAPHPRSGRLNPAPSTLPTHVPPIPSTSILTGTSRQGPVSSTTPQPSTSTTPSHEGPTSAATASPITPTPLVPAFQPVSFSFGNSPAPRKPQSRQVPVFSARSKSKAQSKLRMQEARAARKRMERQAVFGSFGAIMSEAQLHGGNIKRDARWDERRRGDSDVDWGDEDDGGGLASYAAEGMEVDPELELDVEAMKSFAEGMGQEGSRFVTMDDIADQETMKREDEDSTNNEDEEEGETSEDGKDIDAVVNGEEETIIAEPGDIDLNDSEDESGSDGSDEDGQSPRSAFTANLQRLRNSAQGKRPSGGMLFEGEDSSDEDGDLTRSSFTWADDDEDFIAHIETLLDESETILTGRDRKGKRKLFRAVRDGAFGDMEGIGPARKKKDQYEDLSIELVAQWAKDREKKSENKRARALARLELAADPLSVKKRGKKGHKAILAAARLDPTITAIPNRVIDMVTLVQQIRRFLADVGGPSTMSLPPTNKETRKSIHEMAMAFRLKSQSKGKGDSRYITLIKTTRSGFGVDEKKISKLARGGFSRSHSRPERGQGRPVMPRHKDGDEVGKAAPKIGESNVGFKMLAMMGWSEGERIGVTGGLDVPLTAVIKNTKLGLGANR